MFIWDTFHLWFSHHNSNSKGISVPCSNSVKAVTTKFCAWQCCCGMCKKNCDLTNRTWIMAKWNFHRIQIVCENFLLEWAPCLNCRADSRFAPKRPNQWEMSLQCNAVSHAIGWTETRNQPWYCVSRSEFCLASWAHQTCLMSSLALIQIKWRLLLLTHWDLVMHIFWPSNHL